MKKHREKREKGNKETTWLRWPGDGVSTEAAMRERERERDLCVTASFKGALL